MSEAEKTRSSQESTPVVLACDEGYAMPLATTLRSLVESNPAHWPVRIHILIDHFSESVRQRVECSLPQGAANVVWQQVDLTKYSTFATLPHISASTFARFMIPELFPPSVPRVLYLDADILVLGDLQPVWNAQLGGKPVGAVEDVMDQILKSGEPGWEDVAHVNRYFNAGVLLMDLEAWRTERISERALDYLATHPETRLADQDALNVACDGRWHSLESRWNVPCFQNENIGDLPPQERPGIAHFVTRRKPWIARYRSPHWAFYDSFRQRTQFARTPIERLRDAFTRFVAGVKNVLRRRGVWPEGDDWAPPKPVRRASNLPG